MERSFELEGIGTHWWIKIFDDLNDDVFTELRASVAESIREFEDNYSRFKATSYVSILNDTKSLENFPDELLALLTYALEVEEVTAGHFNIGVGKVLEETGYDQNYSFRAQRQLSTINAAKFSELTYERIALHDGIRVDLGGIGKGWLVDKVAHVLRLGGIKSFWINAGGDIYATSNAGEPFEFLLENPFNTQEMIGKIRIMNQAIACSSPNRRRWIDRADGSSRHHLLNAKSGNQVEELAAVFTHGDSCLAADTASTAIFVTPDALTEQVARHYNVNYLVIQQSGNYFKSEDYQGILNT